MNAEQLEELQQDTRQLYMLFDTIARTIKRENRNLYEQWKAGGFLVDENVMCMYPCLSKVVDSIEVDPNEQD